MSMQHEAFAEANVLKERAAAHYVGVSLSTLRRRRASRRRPAFIQIDRSIGYRRAELDRLFVVLSLRLSCVGAERWKHDLRSVPSGHASSGSAVGARNQGQH
jgi:predicted DNA-binding transcriptional regulator AlpA